MPLLIRTDFLVGIPLFYNAGFVILGPLILSIANKTKLPLLYIVSLSYQRSRVLDVQRVFQLIIETSIPVVDNHGNNYFNIWFDQGITAPTGCIK